jgi:hypothetical protein
MLGSIWPNGILKTWQPSLQLTRKRHRKRREQNIKNKNQTKLRLRCDSVKNYSTGPEWGLTFRPLLNFYHIFFHYKVRFDIIFSFGSQLHAGDSPVCLLTIPAIDAGLDTILHIQLIYLFLSPNYHPADRGHFLSVPPIHPRRPFILTFQHLSRSLWIGAVTRGRPPAPTKA